MKNTPVCTMIKDITKNLTVFSMEYVLLDSQGDKIQSTINFPEAAALKLITSENNDSPKQLLTLTTNMKLGASFNSTNRDEIKEFADWVLSIGDGNSSADESADIEIDIPKELLIQDCEDPIQALIDFAYPNLLQNTNTSHYFQDRGILAPTLVR
ncbi:ATP-dependent DNA helicase PIF1 [Trifolium repens]|nr:ATP-dependent DNA helicase PIF1 [Trifolium repens]